MKHGKELWDKLARENAMHFVCSDFGKGGMTGKKFKQSGKKDFWEHIFKDKKIYIGGNQTFLEIGVGVGRMTEFIAEVFFKVIGIDISGEMIIKAQNRLCEGENNNIEWVETDGEVFSFIKDDLVDIAFSYLVFQHMKSRITVESNFSEVYRVLKPGGLFKVRLRTNREKVMSAWWAGVHYSKKDAVKLSKNIGFKVLKTKKVKDYGLWLWLEK